jgi:hypothetical protein
VDAEEPFKSIKVDFYISADLILVGVEHKTPKAFPAEGCHSALNVLSFGTRTYFERVGRIQREQQVA